MRRSITEIQKRGRGRPATGRDPAVTSRISKETIAQVDLWAEKNNVRTRAEAIRHLVELGLTVKSRPKQPVPARAERAKELAGQAIDKMGDPAAHPAEHAQRRHQLTKGPEEFREVRVDRVKAKGSNR
jgi:hypothetical protein